MTCPSSRWISSASSQSSFTKNGCPRISARVPVFLFFRFWGRHGKCEIVEISISQWFWPLVFPASARFRRSPRVSVVSARAFGARAHPGKRPKTRKTARKTRKRAKTKLFSFFPLRSSRGFGILANVFATPRAPQGSLRAEPFCRSRSRKAGRGAPRGAERRTRRGRRRRTPEEGDGTV